MSTQIANELLDYYRTNGHLRDDVKVSAPLYQPYTGFDEWYWSNYPTTDDDANIVDPSSSLMFKVTAREYQLVTGTKFNNRYITRTEAIYIMFILGKPLSMLLTSLSTALLGLSVTRDEYAVATGVGWNNGSRLLDQYQTLWVMTKLNKEIPSGAREMITVIEYCGNEKSASPPVPNPNYNYNSTDETSGSSHHKRGPFASSSGEIPSFDLIKT